MEVLIACVDELNALVKEKERLQDENSLLMQDKERPQDKNFLLMQKEQLQDENSLLMQEKAKLVAENERLREENGVLRAEKEKIVAGVLKDLESFVGQLELLYDGYRAIWVNGDITSWRNLMNARASGLRNAVTLIWFSAKNGFYISENGIPDKEIGFVSFDNRNRR